MDFILEVILCIFLEALQAIANNKEVKFIYRFLALMVVSVFYLLIIWLFIYLSFFVVNNILIIIFFNAINLVLFCFLIKYWINLFKNK